MRSPGSPEQIRIGTEPTGRIATAVYIADLCADLGRMARSGGFGTLAYILDMARLEAESSAQHPEPTER